MNYSCRLLILALIALNFILFGYSIAKVGGGGRCSLLLFSTSWMAITFYFTNTKSIGLNKNRSMFPNHIK